MSDDDLLAASPCVGCSFVTKQAVVALPGYWAPPHELLEAEYGPGLGADADLDLQFYECPIADACLPGGNGSRGVFSPSH